MTWQTVIGLEIHVQLDTKSKLFSGSSTSFASPSNSQVSFVDAGLPGVLPVLNQRAVQLAVRMGLAMGSTINEKNVFSRKNYFYPDLPKGYQITQDAYPIITGGALPIHVNGQTRLIDITRAHLEEDAGKSVHEGMQAGYTGIDLNRAGIPLLEIVSEPQMTSPEEAVALLKTIHTLIRYLEISTGNMQEGAMRCDANVSVRPSPDAPLGTRVELKNINSFKYVEKAINFEVARQIRCLEQGGSIQQETRLYDVNNQCTRSMRSKEDAQDYRYFPDPDLPLLLLDDAYVNQVKTSLPELPWTKKQRFIDEHQLSDYDAHVLTQDKALAHFYENMLTHTQAKKLAANWLTVELQTYLNQHNISVKDSPIDAKTLAQLVTYIEQATLSGKMAKQLLALLWETPHESIDHLIKKHGLAQISDPDTLRTMIENILERFPTQRDDYRQGKDKLFGFFVGQIMKESQGQANPTIANQLLREALDQSDT